MRTMFKKQRVVALPTEKASQFTIFKSKYGLFRGSSIDIKDFNGGDKSYQPQHLYILSNEEIKEDDWVHDDDYDTLLIYQADEQFFDIGKEVKKVIATTDESLGLPRPSNEFLKKYCELGGIDEVLVEYQEWFDAKDGITPIKLRLKVAPDNTITIRPIKNSWSREEVISLIKSFDSDIRGYHWTKEQENWLKENL